MIPKLGGIGDNNGKTILGKTLMDQERKEMRQGTMRWNQWVGVGRWDTLIRGRQYGNSKISDYFRIYF